MAETVTLEEVLVQEVGEFKPEPIYEKFTDSLLFYAKNVPSYAKRLNQLTTVFLARDDDSLVGIEIKGIKGILKRSQGLIAFATDGSTTIGLGVLVGLALAPEPESDVDNVITALQAVSKNWPAVDTRQICAA